jgi:hypothetical protein
VLGCMLLLEPLNMSQFKDRASVHHQEVDLLGQLMDRGLSASEAALFLDRSPPISFSVCCGSRFD